MEMHLSAGLQAKLNKMVTETGRAAGDLVEDAVSGYFAELTQTRNLLTRRYDDVKSGKVQLIDGEEAFARLKAKTEAQRNRSA